MGTQILGHHTFWTEVLGGYGITISPSLSTLLKSKDIKRERQKRASEEGDAKLKRTEKLREKIREEMRQDQVAAKEGKTYRASSGADYKAAQKAVAEERKKRKDNKNKDRHEKTCPYYPHFCDRMGHTSARSVQCKMHSMDASQRVVAKQKNEEKLIRERM